MSFDLYFAREEPVPPQAFAEFFGRRAHYELGATQAGFRNKDTEVYFSFGLEVRPDPIADPESKSLRRYASFSLNYLRPRFFASEAALELAAFFRCFGGSVCDPQADNRYLPQLSPEAFERSYHASNRAATASVAKSEPMPGALRTATELAKIWRWNKQREVLQIRLGRRIFVPRVGFYVHAGRVHSASVWTDVVPIVLPETDQVLVYRYGLAARARAEPTYAIAPFRQVVLSLERYRRETDPLVHYYVKDKKPREGFLRWAKALPAIEGLEAFGMERIIESEG